MRSDFNDLMITIKHEKPTVILLTGKIGSGKDYIASTIIHELQDSYDICKLSFAGEIKRIFRKLFRIYELNVSGTNVTNMLYTALRNDLIKLIGSANISINETKFNLLLDKFEEILVSHNVYNKKLMRECYYIISNDIARKNDQNIWTRCLYNKIELIRQYVDFIVVPDCRKLYEYNFMMSAYNIILVYIDSDVKTRAERRKVTVKEILEMDNWEFEREIDMLKDYADFIIQN